jgi:flavodoxin
LEDIVKALVVYDSVFGNTEKIAQAMGAALAPQAEITTLRVGEVKPEHLAGLNVLLVGSPTRAFNPTPAVKDWLKSLAPNSLKGVKVAAFDTRISLDTIDSSVFRFIVDKGGYAAKAIANALRKKGANLVAPPEGFLVTGEQGPLKDGELERAAAWARQIL